jgi:hypothetical protein
MKTHKLVKSHKNDDARKSLIDIIRKLALQKHFEPARRQRKSEVTIIAKDICSNHPELTNRYPSICNALRDKKQVLQETAKVQLVSFSLKDGPNLNLYTATMIDNARLQGYYLVFVFFQ